MKLNREELRKRALLHLIKASVPDVYPKQKDMARELGFSEAHFTQMKTGKRSIGNESAERIEDGFVLGRGELDRIGSELMKGHTPTNVAKFKPNKRELLQRLSDITETINDAGLLYLLGKAEEVAKNYPLIPKTKRAG